MKDKNRPKLLFVLLFVSIIINLCLIAFLVATLISLGQSRQESKTLKDKVWVLQNRVDSLTPYKPTYSANQEEILKSIVGNPDISLLIKTKPVLGGKWGVWSDKNIKFISEDRFLVIYDDGHLMGAMVIRAKDPANIKSWKVLWNIML